MKVEDHTDPDFVAKAIPEDVLSILFGEGTVKVFQLLVVSGFLGPTAFVGYAGFVERKELPGHLVLAWEEHYLSSLQEAPLSGAVAEPVPGGAAASGDHTDFAVAMLRTSPFERLIAAGTEVILSDGVMTPEGGRDALRGALADLREESPAHAIAVVATAALGHLSAPEVAPRD